MSMFCFQCQETVKNSGCTIQGVCGKKADTANLQDILIFELKTIALNCPYNISIGKFMVESLFMTLTNTNFDNNRFKKQISKAKSYHEILDNKVPFGVLAENNEDIRSLKELITYSLKGISAYLYHAETLGKENSEIYNFIFNALATIAKNTPIEQLINLALETGNEAVKAMVLLDFANTEAFGNPELTKVKISVGKRPGILVSGHDLRDLYELLEQSKGAKIDIYTHGEMLAANCYPKLKKYHHLHGNYGNAWHKQYIEFTQFNGPILMTSNCITPVQESYSQRIFTTGTVGFNGVKHIPNRINNQAKDFSEIIALAKKSLPPKALEVGELTCGIAHNQAEKLMDKVIEKIKSGKIKEFVVMAGCDGRQSARENYTIHAKELPKSSIILTAGCAKYRYNKLNLGDIDGIPRLWDAGQCNDSYSLVLIALKLRDKLKLANVNDLPLVFDIAWYEQKAVAILMALLALEFKNIKIGPTLPAFLSNNIVNHFDGLVLNQYRYLCKI